MKKKATCDKYWTLSRVYAAMDKCDTWQEFKDKNPGAVIWLNKSGTLARFLNELIAEQFRQQRGVG